MPRLFSGLPLTCAIKDRLHQVQSGLRNTRWVDPDDLHLTLRFVGDIDDVQAHAFIENLASISAPPITLSIDGLDAFGHGRPHSVFARVPLTPELKALHAAHEQAARAAGLEPEHRNFTPHVTLGRCRGAKAPEVATWLAEKAMLTVPAFPIEGFAVWSAKQSRGGGPYIMEAFYEIESEQEELYNG